MTNYIKCSAEGCEKKAWAHGVCLFHYRKWKGELREDSR